MICLVRKENKFWYLCIHYILWITFIYKVDWKFIFSFTNFLGHSYCNCIHRNCIFSFGLSYFTIAWEKSQLLPNFSHIFSVSFLVRYWAWIEIWTFMSIYLDPWCPCMNGVVGSLGVLRFLSCSQNFYLKWSFKADMISSHMELLGRKLGVEILAKQ